MPFCARPGCNILIGVTDDHAHCFGHRDCSAVDPCDICESWTLRTTHTLLQAYREQARHPVTQLRNYPPPTVLYSPGIGRGSPARRGRGRTQPAALGAPPLPLSAPASLDVQGFPPPTAPLPVQGRVRQPPVILPPPTSTPSYLIPRPVFLDLPPVREQPSRYPMYHPPEPLSPLFSGDAMPLPPSCTPPLDLCERRLPQVQQDSATPELSAPAPEPKPKERIPWTRPSVLPPPRPRRRRAPVEDWNLEIDGEEDPNVLTLSSNEPLDATDIVRPSTRRASPFPGVSWAELELRTAHLITEILPGHAVAVPPCSMEFYSSCPPATSNRHAFNLAPAILTEFDTISRYLNSPRSAANPSLSLSRPYPWQAMWWVPASQFPIHHPAPEPDTELLVATNPRSITLAIEAFIRRADLLRAILVCGSENALIEEAAFLSLRNLRHTSGEEQETLIENIIRVVSVACRRTDSIIQMASRGVAMDILAHRDAILDASQAPPARRRQLRAVGMLSSSLFNGALAPLRQALLPTAPAPVPPPAAPAAASAPVSSSPRFSSGARTWPSRGGRRTSANGRSNRSRRGNSSGNSRRSENNANQSNSHKRGNRK